MFYLEELRRENKNFYTIIEYKTIIVEYYNLINEGIP